MKVIFLSIVLLWFFGCKEGAKETGLTQLTDEEFYGLISTNNFPNPKDIIRRGQNGNVISHDSLVVMARTIDFKEIAFVDSYGIVQEIHLIPKEPIKLFDVDCATVETQLDSIYKIDQSIRKNFNLSQDYVNLNHVISIIESCGIPDKRSCVKTVFLVLQHNHNSYQKKYIGKLKEQVKKGNFSSSSIAMMEDRILASEGQPQLYGTQVRMINGSKAELIELYQPEKVNQRRMEMGLGPIEPYLEGFGIEFTIQQVEDIIKE